MRKLNFIFLSFFLLFLSGCGKEESSTNKKQDNNSQSFELLTTNNEIIILTKTSTGYKFSNAQSKVVILNFFTTSCKPCNIMFSHLNSLEQKYPNDIKVISILLEKSTTNEELKDFLEHYNVFVDVANGKNNFKLLEEIGGTKNIPLFVIYDKLGLYVTNYVGAILEEMIEADLKRIIN